MVNLTMLLLVWDFTSVGVFLSGTQVSMVQHFVVCLFICNDKDRNHSVIAKDATDPELCVQCTLLCFNLHSSEDAQQVSHSCTCAWVRQ